MGGTYRRIDRRYFEPTIWVIVLTFSAAFSQKKWTYMHLHISMFEAQLNIMT